MSIVSQNIEERPETQQTKPPRVLIGICTLREAENVSDMLAALRAACPMSDLLIVDDNSDDGTAELAQRFADVDGAARVHIRQSTGLGGAIAASMLAAVDGGYEYLVNLDADFSHDPDRVPALIDQAEISGADVVVGSRYAAGGKIEGWPLHRRWMSRRVNRLAIRKFDLPVSDCSGSMRCYRVAALRRLDPTTLVSPGYAVLEEVLHRLNQLGAKMDEVPITFVDRQAGQSKLTIREAIRSVWQIFRLR